MSKRQRRTVGDVVAIPLRTGKYAFGQLLEEPLVGFFEYQATAPDEDVLQALPDKPIAFKVWVMNHAVERGRWKVIGKLAPSEEMRQRPLFFKQDPISGKLSVTTDGGDETPATKEQCQGLERAAVWEPSHVEDRLADHFESRANKWVESLRLR